MTVYKYNIDSGIFVSNICKLISNTCKLHELCHNKEHKDI